MNISQILQGVCKLLSMTVSYVILFIKYLLIKNFNQTCFSLNNLKVFTITFDQLNIYLLNESINFFKILAELKLLFVLSFSNCHLKSISLSDIPFFPLNVSSNRQDSIIVISHICLQGILKHNC